jgi:hypothetical protein
MDGLSVPMIAQMILLFSIAQPLWVLEYHCDSRQCGEDRGERSFHTKQLAIDWINEHYEFAPGLLKHGSRVEECGFTYLYPDAEDEDHRLMKSVECMTAEEYAVKYCQGTCIW